MMKTNLNFKNYLKDGALIVFSVLFALVINNSFENFKLYRKKKTAEKNIKLEIENNQKSLTEASKVHQKIAERLDSLNTESVNNLNLTENTPLDYTYYVGNNSLFNEMLSETAWETAKTTDIISEFEFQEVDQLTKLYNTQNLFMNKTIMRTYDTLMNPDSYKPENKSETIQQLQLQFREILGQEQSLNYYYESILKED